MKTTLPVSPILSVKQETMQRSYPGSINRRSLQERFYSVYQFRKFSCVAGVLRGEPCCYAEPMQSSSELDEHSWCDFTEFDRDLRSVDQMAELTSDSPLEAFAHSCTETEVREWVSTLTARGRSRLATHGHIAISRALVSNKESTGVARALLDQPEIQVNLPQAGRDESTLLQIAVSLRHTEAVRMLLARADLDPNVGDRREDTPVHLAARPGASLEILLLLVSDPRVNIAAVNSDKQTPLHAACKSKCSPGKDSHAVAAVRILVAAAATSLRSLPEFLRNVDVFGRNALHYAAESGLDATIDELLRQPVIADHHLQLVQDNAGYQAVHLATQNGHLTAVERLLPFGCQSCNDAVQKCLTTDCSLPKLCSDIHLYCHLLSLTTHHHIAEFFLTNFNVSTHIEEPEKNYASLLHWAVKINDSCGHGAHLIPHILKWQQEKANEPLDDTTGQTPLHVATIDENRNAVESLCRRDSPWHLDANQRDIHCNTPLDYAFKTDNDPIRRILMKRADVKEHLARLHKNREAYAVASNAILVVAVLVATLTYSRCLTGAEVAQQRQDGSLTTHFHLGNTVIPTRVAFFLSMAATIFAAFAALPFSFGFFFTQTVDDHYVRRSLYRTRLLIVLASNCLMLALGAVLFAFVCSQYIAPYIKFHCEVACVVVLLLFVAVSVVFLVTNMWRVWVERAARKAKGSRVSSRVGRRPLVAL